MRFSVIDGDNHNIDEEKTKERLKMEYILLNNGVLMPLVGLGTWDLRGQECIEIVSKAIELGYRLIDTAQMYGNEKEVGLGILKSDVSRDELFITTKIYRISNNYEKAKKAIDTSLENLQLDYIDLLLLHEPYQQGTQMYKALEEAYQKGKIRAIGISNYNEKWYQKFIKGCSIIPAVNQVEAHVFFQKWDLQELLSHNKTVMQAWSPLAQGMGNILQQPTLVSIARKYNKTPAQIALRFLTQRKISVIPKSNKESRLMENKNIFDFELTNEEMKMITKLDNNKTQFTWTENF